MATNRRSRRTTGSSARGSWCGTPESPETKGMEATATLEGLRAKGAVLLACNLAAMGYAYEIAERTKQHPKIVRAEVRANLAPGVILQPSGIYATIRAQEMGAGFMRSS